MMKKLYLLIAVIFIYSSINAQEIIVRESIGDDGNKEIKYKIKDNAFNSIRKVRLNSSGKIIDDVSLISEEKIAEISISINGAIISKTFGDFDIGYSLDKDNKIRTIVVIDKRNHTIAAGYTIKDNIYQKIIESEYKNIDNFSVMDLIK